MTKNILVLDCIWGGRHGMLSFSKLVWIPRKEINGSFWNWKLQGLGSQCCPRYFHRIP